MQYCSLQILLPSQVKSTNGCCFCFGSGSSFFLELFLHSSPVACWAPTNLESSSFRVIPFCLFMLFMGFSRQDYRSGLPFPSPVKNTLEEINSRISEGEEKISEMEGKMVEITAQEQNKVRRTKGTEDSIRDFWDDIKCTNI